MPRYHTQPKQPRHCEEPPTGGDVAIIPLQTVTLPYGVELGMQKRERKNSVP